MPVIWAAISAHGYGHAAQVIPVLNELGARVPRLSAVLRTTVPESFFRDRLSIPWSRLPVQQDVGCIQQGPLQIDVHATWEAHARFHETWERRVGQEVEAMRAAAPRLILADTPYLACAAGAEAGIPTVGLANFTWSEVLTRFDPTSTPQRQRLVGQIEQLYAKADFALRIAPGLPLNVFKSVENIGPIAQPVVGRPSEVRLHLQLPPTERLVLIGFGGISLSSLPWERMDEMKGYHFLVDGIVTHRSIRIHDASTLPYSFKTLLASCDVIMTKPGYGTTVEAVALNTPVVYVRRHNFADEQPLVDFLSTYGRSAELSQEDFAAGRWDKALQAALISSARTTPPLCSGAADAAERLKLFF